MTIFLISMCATGVLIIGGLLWYQKKNILLHTDQSGKFIDRGENPLSLKNINSSRVNIQIFIKEEIRYLIVELLKLLLKIKRVTRRLLDRGITRLANLAFPEEKLNGPVDENGLLLHVEDHIQNSTPGRIE